MMSSDRVMFMYHSYTYCSTGTHSTISDGDYLIVVFPFSNPRFGPYIYSSSMVSSLVAGQSGSWLLLIILS